MKTVLIVDDIAFVRKTLSTVFSRANYEVVGEASDGNQAVELFYKLRPNLVTMDIVMPIMSGIEATRKIIAIDPRATILIISSMEQEHLLMEAIHVGAQDYLFKPFQPEQLIKTLERIEQMNSSALHRNQAHLSR